VLLANQSVKIEGAVAGEGGGVWEVRGRGMMWLKDVRMCGVYLLYTSTFLCAGGVCEKCVLV
jgi:hypothetical protein